MMMPGLSIISLPFISTLLIVRRGVPSADTGGAWLSSARLIHTPDRTAFLLFLMPWTGSPLPICSIYQTDFHANSHYLLR